MKQTLSLLLVLLVAGAMPLQAQKKKHHSAPPRITGLSVSVDAGLLIPNAKQANFYSGRPGNENTISRVLYSEQYGHQIWNSLVDQQLISPSTSSSSRPVPSPPTAPSASLNTPTCTTNSPTR